jgi:hypothetical protein
MRPHTQLPQITALALPELGPPILSRVIFASKNPSIVLPDNRSPDVRGRYATKPRPARAGVFVVQQAKQRKSAETPRPVNLRGSMLEPSRSATFPSGPPLCHTKSMKKARSVKQIVLGRPRTGVTPQMGFRAGPAIRAAIIKWAESQSDKPTRSEAIRRLVEIGLGHSKPTGRRSAESVDRATQLAAKAIDGLVDPASPADEAANRTRRLLKGPEEFREVRRDQLKG